MSDIDDLLINRKAVTCRLLSFGFCKSEKGYIYATHLADGQLEMRVTITNDAKVSAEVSDISLKERYVLHRVPGASGAFVGKVREEYEQVLAAIANDCFEPDVFKSKCAKQIIRHVREKYRDEPQFLWKRTPQNAIFRRQDNAKWYAALLVIQKRKLGLNADGTVDIIDLRAKPEDIDALVDGKSYFPGYHMNKKHWITICLDGSVADEEIFQRIDESFALAKSSAGKYARASKTESKLESTV
ncbi:MAG: MmcQ/YjbR family DNA-binding protein [Dehalococcoidia bacterium]|nr:MmcQ/YjbR family DNA-binding protein [Dehalococcoidia bacterium]